jgi:CxxC-x17-CxxC domain-containing protein
MYLKLMIDGVTSTPFSARGLRPLTESEKTNNIDKVIRNSREKYANDREVVEEKIMRWHEDEYEENEQASDSKDKKKNSDEGKYSATCSRCSAETKTPFKPDGIRPVYCKDCLGALKEEKNKSASDRKKEKEKELKSIDEDVFKKAFNNNLNNLKKKNASVKGDHAQEGKEEKKEEEPKTGGLSLKDLNKKTVVDFKGRVKKVKAEKRDNKDYKQNSDREDNNKEYKEENIKEENTNREDNSRENNNKDIKNIKGEGDLREGEEINF